MTILKRCAPDFNMKRRAWPLTLGLGYVVLIAVLGGLQFTHVLLASLSLLDAYNKSTRHFLKSFFPCLLAAVMFDSMRYYYWQGIEGKVRIAEPYLMEKALFGIFDSVKNGMVTPNEYFEHRISAFLDLSCGFAYLTFIFEYFACAALLYFVVGLLDLLKIMTWSFFTVNAMGFATYFVYPAAPPWYITLYGFGPARMDVKPNPAATVRFDEILGTHFFTGMYGQGIDVYGSIPSLHVSYPFIVCWVTWQLVKRFSVPLKSALMAPPLGFFLLMCFSAVYLQHHYVIDVVLGVLYAVLTLFVVSRGLRAVKHV